MTPATMQDDDVIEGVTLLGRLNTDDATVAAQVRHAIRQGHPQLRPMPPNPDRVALVCGGPSLNDTLDELIELYFAGARVVTVNGAYHWCLTHNIRPSAQIVLDARPSTPRFVEPARPRCIYFVASQCHADVWASVADRPQVEIFHAVASEDSQLKPILDDYYGDGRWVGIGGGTTVALRAIGLLRTLGYLRFDLFGFDSCFLGAAHHAFDQPENQRDRPSPVEVYPVGHPELARTFHCAPWMLAQFEDFLKFVKHNGDQVLLNVHGDGLIAYALKSSAELVVSPS